MDGHRDARPRVLLLDRRDTTHPEGGGSERYVERMAEGLARQGYRVTIQCAAHSGAAAGEWVSGVRFRRRGTKFTVYLHGLLAILRVRADLVVDVQNGMPFFSRLVAGCPVLVLVHHVHKEQWLSAFGQVVGRLGWWIESKLAPRVYRKCQYLTVSEVTRAELAGMGVDPARTSVVPNGLDPPPRTLADRDQTPTLVAVSRLVSHKRIEHAVDVVAELSEDWPKLRLEIVGHGPWGEALREYVDRSGVQDRVTLHGWVEERDKHEILAQAWLHLCPSVKEGWGIAIMEAAAHGVPSIAYRSAGGVTESIVDGRTGRLATDFDEFVSQVAELLRRQDLRAAMGAAGRDWAMTFRWEHSLARFEQLVRQVGQLSAPRPRLIAGS